MSNSSDLGTAYIYPTETWHSSNVLVALAQDEDAVEAALNDDMYNSFIVASTLPYTINSFVHTPQSAESSMMINV